MAGRSKQTSSTSNESASDAPPQKKRKMAAEEEGLWDDSLEFTEADLDHLEVQASQAYVDTSTLPLNVSCQFEAQPKKNKAADAGRLAMREDQTGTFLLPEKLHPSSSTSSCGSNVVAVGDPNTTDTSNTSRGSTGFSRHGSVDNSSHNSSRVIHAGSGSANLSTSSASYPSTVSSYGRRSSSSLVSVSSDQADVVLCGQSSSVSRCISSDSMDPPASMLGSEEIGRYKQDKLKVQADLVRLQTQMQFKDQELREAGDRCRQLETQLKNLPIPQSPQVPATLQVVDLMKQPQTVSVDERTSPRSKAAPTYPTTSSFMRTEGSPQKHPSASEGSPCKHPQTEVDRSLKIVKDTSTMTTCLQNTRRSMKLNIPFTRSSSGSRLVAKLLDVAPSSSRWPRDRGVVGLLQTPAASLVPQNLEFERDKDSRLLSPIRNRRLSDVQPLIAQQEIAGMKSIVTTECFNLTLCGLTGLLRQECVLCSSVKKQTALPSVINTTAVDSPATSLVHVETNTSYAVLLLPLINDYLRHYLEMLTLSFEMLNISNPSKVASSSSPESFENLIESPSGSLGIMLRESTSYANNMENLALVSLRTLRTLASCSEVRWILLHSETTDELRSESRQNSNESARSASRNSSDRTCTQPRGLNISIEFIYKLHLLHNVLKMANPGSKGELYSSAIMETTLRILTNLAIHSTEQHMHCLLPILSDEILQNCLQCDSKPLMVIHGLRLLRSMCKSNLIVSSMCSNATGCVLLSLYELCRKASLPNHTSIHTTLEIHSLVVRCLSCIASSHKGGLTILLESDCQCSVQVVPSLVRLLHYVLHVSRRAAETACEAHRCMELLQLGCHLMHAMSQHTVNFVHQHMAVQHEYVALICGLSTAYKNFPKDRENELAALSDLWDFDQDDAELSQESDEDQDRSTMDNAS